MSWHRLDVDELLGRIISDLFRKIFFSSQSVRPGAAAPALRPAQDRFAGLASG